MAAIKAALVFHVVALLRHLRQEAVMRRGVAARQQAAQEAVLTLLLTWGDALPLIKQLLLDLFAELHELRDLGIELSDIGADPFVNRQFTSSKTELPNTTCVYLSIKS